MLPLSDGLPARRFPIVNVGLIVANFAVWIFYELPHLNSSVFHASFYPCAVKGTCRARSPGRSAGSPPMFLHGSWDHILGNMLFLAIFGKNVEDAFGRSATSLFYIAGGFVATLTQTAMTLLFGTAADARTFPTSARAGRSRLCSARSSSSIRTPRVRTWVLVFIVKIPAWFYLGAWFLFQLIDGGFGIFAASSHGSGVAFFAHIGGFVFGVLVARALLERGRVGRQSVSRRSALAPF